MVNVPPSTFQSIPPLVPSVAGFSSSGTLAVPVSPSAAIAVGTSVNIIVSDNNIARIRCFITFTS